MNINAKRIEELGGLVSLTMELNTPDFPEVDQKEITAYLFDAFGVAQCDDKYLFLTYPGIGNAKMDKQIRRTINQNRFGNRLPDNFKVTIDDLAMCFAEVEEINHEEYVRQLYKGIFSNSKSLFKGTKMTAEKFREHNLRIIKRPCKHLYIYQNESDFLSVLDGKIYAVCDMDGKYLCDVLEEDLLQLETEKKVIDPSGNNSLNDMRICDAAVRDYIYSQRIEIIILSNPKTI